MKTYLISLLIILFVSCWINDAGYRPAEMKVGLKEIRVGSSEPVVRGEGMIAEPSVTDGARVPTFSNYVTDRSGFSSSDFPIGNRY